MLRLRLPPSDSPGLNAAFFAGTLITITGFDLGRNPVDVQGVYIDSLVRVFHDTIAQWFHSMCACFFAAVRAGDLDLGYRAALRVACEHDRPGHGPHRAGLNLRPLAWST
jgi:hypothetical protein